MRVYSVHTLGCEGSRTPCLVILLLIATLLSAACSKPLAVGKLTEIVVLADEEVWEEIESDIRGALEREILSTRPETTFRVYHASLQNPGKFRKWSKLILVGSLEGGGPTNRPDTRGCQG